MANEIQMPVDVTGTYYAVLRNTIGQIWNTSGVAFETYQTANLAQYVISLTEQGTASQYYSGNLPSSLAAGEYHCIAYMQIGGSPSEGDILVGTVEFHWNGSKCIPRSQAALGTNYLELAP